MNRSKNQHHAQGLQMAQPKDTNHPVFAMIKRYIVNSDAKVIAYELGIRPSTVYMVKNGKVRSVRVWNKLIELATARRESELKVLEYLKK